MLSQIINTDKKQFVQDLIEYFQDSHLYHYPAEIIIANLCHSNEVSHLRFWTNDQIDKGFAELGINLNYQEL
jgi:hypothetical protein